MSHWVAAWGTAPSNAERTPAQYARDITLRYTLRVGIGGSAMKLGFSNLFGDLDAELTRVTVRTADGRSHAVTFGGQTSAVIPMGGALESDELPAAAAPGTDVTVSLYLGQLCSLRTGCACSGPYVRGRFAQGDRCDEADFSLLWAKDVSVYYFLTDLTLLAQDDVRAMVAFGDSITAQSWPERLMDRLLAQGRSDLSVIRRAISGSRVLREYDSIAYLAYGPMGMKRFEREVLAPGVQSVLILHGVNDIIHPDGVNPCRPMEHLPTAQELIDGLSAYIGAARRHGLKVYIATITPMSGWRTDAPFRQTLRAEVNAWIRTTDEIDGYVDFAALTCDPSDETRLLPACDSGDHLHPSDEGARRMAMGVPEAFL